MKKIFVHIGFQFLISLTSCLFAADLNTSFGLKEGEGTFSGIRINSPRVLASKIRGEVSFIGRTSEVSDMERGICRQSSFLTDQEPVVELTNTINQGFRSRYCSFGLTQTGLLSKNICDESEACSMQFKLNLTKSSAQKYLKNIIAQDFAKNFLKENLEKIERTELARKDLEENYNIKSKCGKNYDYKSSIENKCNGDIVKPKIDESYANFLKTCDSQRDGENCPINKENFFKKYEAHKIEINKKNDKRGTANTFLEKIADNKMDAYKSQSKDFLKHFSKMITEDSFKKLTDEEKVFIFLGQIGFDNMGRMKDPYFAYEFENFKSNSKKIIHEKEFKPFLDLINNNKISSDEFLNEFHKIKKEKLKKIFVDIPDYKCNQMLNLNVLCEEMTNILDEKNGQLSEVNPIDFERYFTPKVLSSNELIDVQKLLGDAKINETEANILINSLRCKMYGPNNLVGPIDQLTSTFSIAPGNGSGIKLGSSPNQLDLIPRDSTAFPPKGFIPTEASESTTSAQVQAVPDMKAKSPDNSPSGGGYVNGHLPSNFEGNFVPSSQTSDVNLPPPRIPESLVPTDGKSTAGASTTSRELQSKLATAEARVRELEKSQASGTSQLPDGNVNNKKNEELDNLRNDITALKDELRSKKDLIAGPLPINPVGNATTPSSTGQLMGGSLNPTRDLAETPNASNLATTNGTVSSSNFVGSQQTSLMTGPDEKIKPNLPTKGNSVFLTSMGNSTGVTTIELASGDTVFSFVGLAPEKVAEIISTRFKNPDLKNIPFYIEEAGYVKEVVPMLNDKGEIILDANGNPTYITAIKGKLGDKKFAVAKDVLKGRAPAALADMAEQKRVDEGLVNRGAAYEIMKKLTREAINENK